MAALLLLLQLLILADTDVAPLVQNLESSDSATVEAALNALREQGANAAPALDTLKELSAKICRENEELGLAVEQVRWEIETGVLTLHPKEQASLLHTLSKVEMPSTIATAKHFEYFLQFTGTNSNVPLGKAYVYEAYPDHPEGIYPESLEVYWLVPDQLLWIWWQTVPQGSGGNSAQCNILLARTESGWKEVFRDYRNRYSQSGADNHSAIKMAFTVDNVRPGLLLTEVIACGENESLRETLPPLANEYSEEAFQRHYYFRTTWHGVLQDGQISFGPGSCFLQVENLEREVELEEVAAFLENPGQNFLDEPILDSSIDSLKRSNPGLKKLTPFNKHLLLSDTVPPFVAKKQHLYRWEDN